MAIGTGRQTPAEVLSCTRLRLIGLLSILLFGLLHCGVAASTEPLPLRLTNTASPVDLWPHWQMLIDPGGELAPGQVLARQADFRPLGMRPYANLGPQRDTVWLHAVVHAPAEPALNAGAPGQSWWWVMEYTQVSELDVYLMAADGVVQQGHFGYDRPFVERPWPTLSFAFALEFKPGQRYDLLVRLNKKVRIALLVPISLQSSAALTQGNGALHFWQGLAFGVGLCLTTLALVAFSLQRSRMFLCFAVFAASATLMSLNNFGVGIALFWDHTSGWLARPVIAPMLVLAASGILFIDLVLEVRQHRPWVSRMLRVGVLLLLAVLVVYLLGGVTDNFVSLLLTFLAPVPLLVALPLVVARVRRGDRLATWTLLGLLPHAMAQIVAIGMHRGFLPATVWTMHAVQIGCTLDLLAWTAVLILRSNRLLQAVAIARQERRHLLHEARTDALTGLLNRRGLSDSLPALLVAAGPQQMVALYMIDLDGFKFINDNHGHDVGDAVLLNIAGRLKSAVLASDLVCRLGGDEFVVVCPALVDVDAAEVRGAALLDTVRQPLAVGALNLQIGMTVGYSLACRPVAAMADFLQRADQAMYVGKRGGRGRLVRADGANPPLTPA